jgi:hypothetical protein
MAMILRKIARFIIIVSATIISAHALVNLFMFCTSNFLSTVVVYGLLLTLSVRIFRTGVQRQGIGLVLISTLLVLFISEVFLRFVRKDPITYSEMHGNGYASMYRTDVLDNWYVLRVEGRKDIHTLEWAPSEVRDNTTLDYRFPDYRCNAKGLRGELPRPRSKVILAVGDSFTEGAGTPCDSTYTVLLEKHLRQDDPSRAVINAGVSGNDPFFDYQMLRKLHPEFDIQHVVFLINTTDVNDVQMRGGMERFLPSGKLDYPDGPWWEPIYAVSFVSRLFFHSVLKVERNLMTSDDHSRTMLLAIDQLAELFRAEVVPFAREHGFGVHVITHPLLHEALEDTTVYSKLALALSSVSGITFRDCRRDLIRGTGVEQLYWPNDRHFRPEGYALLATCVHGSLLDARSEGDADDSLERSGTVDVPNQ